MISNRFTGEKWIALTDRETDILLHALTALMTHPNGSGDVTWEESGALADRLGNVNRLAGAALERRDG